MKNVVRTTLKPAVKSAAAVEETGLRYKWKETGVEVGVRRWGGYQCPTCHQSLLQTHDEANLRSAHKKHTSECKKCGVVVSKGNAVPVSSFDWYVAPHVIPRPTAAAPATVVSAVPAAAGGVAATPPAAPTGALSAEPSVAAVSATAVSPASSAGSVTIVDQYGQSVDASTFWTLVVEPCPWQMYSRIPAFVQH